MNYNIEKTLSATKELLVDGSPSANGYIERLAEMGEIVSLSASDEQFRKSISQQPKVLELLLDIVADALNVSFDSETILSLYFRLFRGVLLLVRNLVSVYPESIDLPLFLLSIQHFNLKLTPDDPLYERTVLVYVQTLANMTHAITESTKGLERLLDLVKITLFDTNIIQETETLPALTFLNNLFSSNAVVYDLLTNENPILSFLLSVFEQQMSEEKESLDPEDRIIISIFQKIASHESLSKWLKAHEGPKIVPMLKACQLVVTAKDDWTNYQLVAILSWAYEQFELHAKEAEALLVVEEPEKLAATHTKLVVVLDVISDLCKFNETRQFLEHYHALEKLITLLRAVEQNVERKTLKSSEQKIERLDNSKVFPQVKSLIVETIAFLVHNSFDNQEKVRELHGLELVLSNCMIDDNEPFIKERAIVCLKFLLEKNSGNQAFVAQLEAKKTVDDLALREVGYEVEIQNGEVKMKRTQ